MTASLRPFARSRCLGALGALAWLLLVINSLAAAPLGRMGGPQAHPLHAAVVTLSQRGHLAAPAAVPTSAGCADRSCCNDQAGCCDGLTLHGCSCAAMCSASLPPEPLITLAPAGIGRTYALPPSISAPSLHAAPPLRPPLA